MRFPSAVVFSLGERPKATYRKAGGPPITRMGTAALIRKALQDAAAYAKKQDAAGSGGGGVSDVMGFLAVTLASINIFGGFLVSHRMLSMFKKKKR